MKRLVLVAVSVLTLVACSRSEDKPKEIQTSVSVTEIKKGPGLDECKINVPVCSSVDIDRAEAKEAYRIGCEAKDYYSCFRLGQYHETRSGNVAEAVKAYEKSCLGKDKDGCESDKSLRSKLCYLGKQKSYCKGEPHGEYRIFVFLEDLNPKYEDAFVSRDFSIPLSLGPAQKLYQKRIEEKNPKLLKALRLAKAKGKRDGADAEGLTIDILKLEGKTKELDSLGE